MAIAILCSGCKKELEITKVNNSWDFDILVEACPDCTEDERKEAREDGYDDGYDNGYETGYEAGISYME